MIWFQIAIVFLGVLFLAMYSTWIIIHEEYYKARLKIMEMEVRRRLISVERKRLDDAPDE